MTRRHTLLLLILAVSLFSCKLNPPTEPAIIQPTGKIYVTANVDSAVIILDGNSTGKFTPDTITVTVGEHELELMKDNYFSSPISISILKNQTINRNIVMTLASIQKTVLIEDFSNVSCIPCVASNIILEKISSQYSETKLVKIKYPTNFPSPNDPFYLSNPNACNTRIMNYSIFSTPTIWIDGINKPIATDSLEIKNDIDNRLSETPKFNITVSDSIGSNNYFIKVKLETINISNLDLTKIYLYAVVTEKVISFSTPPGSNGETEFYDVMREMLPNPNGFQLGNISSNDKFEYSYSTELKSNWNLTNITTVVFIQNKESKEVYQANSVN